MTQPGEKKPRGFIATTLRRPITVLMALTASLAVAAIACVQMPTELIPESMMGGRRLHISVGLSDASPREVEEEIVKPIEEALGSVPDIKEIESEASENEGEVDVEFTERADLDLAYTEVRDRIERIKGQFPDNADRYRIRKRGGRGIPIIWMGINFDQSLTEVSPLIDEVVRQKLERIDGIASAGIWGLAADEVRIEINDDALRSNGVNLYELVQRLRGENVSDLSGGFVHEGERKYYVRTMSRFRDLDEVRAFPVQPGLTLGEIAEVKKAYALERFIFRAHGRSAVGVSLFKESQANTAEVCKEVERVLDEELKTDPRLAGLDYRIFFNQGEIISASLNQLRDTAAYGALFALAILYVFLRRARMTLLITAAIPISALTALGALFFFGATINMFSLMGFTLAVGMLVDNSVVVVENIVRRRNAGEAPFTAALLGAKQVGLAIFMSTLTTMVVFLPFLFMADSGPSRNALLEVVLPLIFSLTASLAVSLGLIPIATLAFVSGKKQRVATNKRPGLIVRFGNRVARLYTSTLDAALRHRFVAMLLAVAFLMSGSMAGKMINRSNSSMRQRAAYRVSLDFPKQFTLREASAVVADYERIFAENKRDLKLSFFWSQFNRRSGSLGCTLEKLPDYGPKDLAKRAAPLLPTHPGVVRNIRFEGQDEQADEKTTIPILLYGPDSRVLSELADELKPILAGIPYVTEVVGAEDEGLSEIHLAIDRTKAGKYGVDPQVVRGTVAYALQGARLLDFGEEDREIPMMMRFSAEETEGIQAFEKFMVSSRSGEQIPLEAVASYGFTSGFDRIIRRNRRTVYPLNVRFSDPKHLWATKLRVDAALATFTMPQGYSTEPAGSVSSIEDEAAEMQVMVLYAVLFVFLLMGVLFESVVLPATILITIPTAIVGGIWALVLTGTALDGVGFLGFIILVGIVVNNGIVMVDYINRLRAEGSARTDAVRIGARDRFRPILMTALTTIGGLTPIVLSPPAREGFDYLPMSRIVVGGLFAATIFSLYLVPVTYTLLDDLREWVRRVTTQLVSRRKKTSAIPPAVPPQP